MAAPKQLLTGFAKTARTTKPDPKRRLTIRDPDTRGLFVRISPVGGRSWLAMTRGPDGKQVWATIGDAMTMEVSEAREKAREVIQRVKQGNPAKEEPAKPPETFKVVAERFLTRWVRQGGKKQDGVSLRSAGEIERQFKTYIYPEWSGKPFLSIRRGNVTELVDHLVENSGAVQADRVLATLSKLFNWYRQYDENYVNPIIPEMRRSGSMKDRARERTLNDDEIRTLWADWTTAGTFGAFLQIALLTGQRRAKVQTMRWEDISEDGVWAIPAEAREKVNAGTLKLPKAALDIINAQPKIKDHPYVFAGRGKKPIGSFSKQKREMAERVSIEPWTVHDLRRTARSLMSRAGVRPDHAERTLGHVIAGVGGTYDRHGYLAEKTEALEKLAALVELILNPPTDNVIPMTGRAE
jgi:integrase